MKSESHRNNGRFIRPDDKSANNHHIHPCIKQTKKKRLARETNSKGSRKKKRTENIRANTEAPRAETEVAREREVDGAGAIVENQFTILFVDGDQNPLLGEL